jgi:hypothetical protein
MAVEIFGCGCWDMASMRLGTIWGVVSKDVNQLSLDTVQVAYCSLVCVFQNYLLHLNLAMLAAFFLKF